MENIKLYINANIDEVKKFLDKLIVYIIKRYPNLEELYNKTNKNDSKNNYWNVIYDKLNIYSNYITIKNLNSKEINFDITIILFLLFGITDKSDKKININLELYELSMYSNEINNFRNCVIIILIQKYIFINNKEMENNEDNIINSITRIIKCSYIKKSIHIIKSLLKKQKQTKIDLFLKILFYYIYEKYKNNFISFIESDDCDIKSEYKNIIIKEYSTFSYNETSSINFNSKIFEIKLSYSLLGINPKEKKVLQFLETIKDKKLRLELLNVFEKYYYEYFVKKEKTNKRKNDKLINVLNRIQTLKNNMKEIKNSLNELKDMQNNYMDDIFRILNIINK